MNYTWVDHEIFNIYTVHRLIGVSVYNNYTLSFYTEMWAALFVQLAFSIYIYPLLASGAFQLLVGTGISLNWKSL